MADKMSSDDTSRASGEEKLRVESDSLSIDSLNTITVLKASDGIGVKVELNGTDSPTFKSMDVNNKMSDKNGEVENSVVKQIETTDTESENNASKQAEEMYRPEEKNGRKSESPSEELVDSIEETVVLANETELQTISNVEDSPDDRTDKSFHVDAGEDTKLQTNQLVETMSLDKDIAQPEKGEVSNTDPVEKTKITSEVREVNTESIPSQEDTTQSLTKGAAEFKEGVSSPSSSSAVTDKDKSDDASGGDDEFRGMTEEEIQAIIDKYSYMDRSTRVKCLQFFWSLDVERCGYFNYPQFRYWYRAQGSRLPGEEIARIYTDLDRDRDNLVSLDEFLLEMSKNRPRPYTQDELQELFKHFDKNQDGFICAEDIRAALDDSKWDGPTSFEIFRVLQYDTSGKLEKLNFTEFSRYLQDKMKERMPTPQF